MCALAHAFEAAGLATVALASVLGQVERSRPPRALYCDFPLGRSLGKVDDPAFQTSVLRRAFELLERPSGPVLEHFPEAVTDDASTPASCPLPPRHDPTLHPAVDEVGGLRPAWERAQQRNEGRTALQFTGVDQIVPIVEAMVRVVDEGVPWKEAQLPAHPHDAMIDLRAYYEEAATALAEHTPAARSAETWFYETTEAGRLVLAFRDAIKAQGAGFGTWFYTTPFNR